MPNWFGSQQDTTQQTTQNNWFQPYQDLYSNVFNQALQGYEQVPQGTYQGPRVPNTPFATRLGRRNMLDVATNLQQNQTAPWDIMNLATQTAQGDFLSPNSNPYLRQTISAAIRPVREQFLNEALPASRSAAIAGGAYGGSDQEAEDARLTRDFGRTASDTSAQIAFNNLARERMLQQQAPQMYRQGAALAMLPAEIRQQVGSQLYSQQLAQIAADQQQFNESINAPYQGLGFLTNLLGLPSGGSTTSTTNSEAPSLASQFLQGAIGGAGAAGSMYYNPQQGSSSLWQNLLPIAGSGLAAGLAGIL